MKQSDGGQRSRKALAATLSGHTVSAHSVLMGAWYGDMSAAWDCTSCPTVGKRLEVDPFQYPCPPGAAEGNGSAGQCPLIRISWVKGPTDLFPQTCSRAGFLLCGMRKN